MGPAYGSLDVTSLSVEQLVQLVTAIADPSARVMFISQANENDGWADTVEEAVRSGRAFCVKAREDVLVLDDDSNLRLAEKFVDEYCGDFDHLVCMSGQEERQHGYVVVEDPAQREWLANRAREFGIGDVSYGRSIRPPGAPHRLGGRSTPLGVRSVKEVVARLFRVSRNSGLGTKATRALYEGDERGDRSKALFSATMGMVNAGWSEERMWSTLLGHPGGAKLQGKIESGQSEAKVRKWWRKCHLGRARQYVAARPVVRSAGDALVLIGAAKAWMAAHRWKGVGGATDRAVLSFFLEQARRHRRAHGLALSNREVAEGTGLASHVTANRSLGRLRKLGIIRFVPKAEVQVSSKASGPRSNYYSIACPTEMTDHERLAWHQALDAGDAGDAQVQHSQSGGRVPECSTTDAPTLGHDAFRYGALTKSKFHVWRKLSLVEPMTTRRLADGMGYKRTDTVGRHLRKLEQEGLAQRTPKGWLRIEGDLGAVAERHGTTGKGAQQKLVHQRQREANRRKLEVPNLDEFVAKHLRNDSTAVTTHHALWGAYNAFCRQRTTAKEIASPHDLANAIYRRFPTVMHSPRLAGQSVVYTTGGDRWHGLLIVDNPFTPTEIPTLMLDAA